MLRTVLAFAFSLSLALTSPAQSAGDPRLTPQQVEADVSLAREAYSRVHPGYSRYTNETTLAQAWEAIKARAVAESGLSVADLYLEIQRVLTLIRCDHTKAELPKAMKEARKIDPIYLPFHWQLVEGRGFIVQPGENTQLGQGEEILAIDGRPLNDLIAEVEPFIPYDGKTVWTRSSGVADSLEFMGGALDHFGALLWQPSATAAITIRDRDGKERVQTVQRISYRAYAKLRQATASDFKDAVLFDRIGSSTAYLRIDTFVNYRNPIKPDDLYDPIFKAIKEEKRDTLILDLRNNGGGSNDAQMRLTAHLIPTRIKQNKELRVATLDLDGLREHLWTWHKRALKPNRLGFRKNDDGTYSIRGFVSDDLKNIKPDKYVFEGQLIVLTSNANSSASTSLVALLDEHRDATLIGERTGGSAEGPTAGLQFTLTLPESGIPMRLPFIRYYNNIEQFEPGLGLSPDIEAPLTVAAFLAGVDPALEQAKRWIESNRQQ